MLAAGKRPENQHRCGMGAGHLHHESAFDLALRLCAFDECQAGVHSYFGNIAAWQPALVLAPQRDT